MRFKLAAFCLVLLAACAAPQSAGPSSAILAMRDRFETEVLGMEGKHVGDADGLRKEAAAIAERIYGADWSVVRAEAQRSLAALPLLDLAAYARLPASAAIPPDSGVPPAVAPYLTPAGLAMMRFWDAQAAGSFVGTISVAPDFAGDTMEALGVKVGLVPTRVYRGRFNNADVLAARYFRAMVIAPYSITSEGMILPDFAHVTIYPLQR